MLVYHNWFRIQSITAVAIQLELKHYNNYNGGVIEHSVHFIDINMIGTQKHKHI